MDDLASRYDAWKAPQNDGAVLLWPEPRTLIAQARENQQSLARAASPIQNTPLSELRRQLRQFLGIQDDRQLAFLTGHQTELHHPGVWAKNVLIDAAASAIDGVAMHVAVDTDAPKHLSIRFPGFNQPFTDDPAAASADWAQLVAPPTPAHLASLSGGLSTTSEHLPFSLGVQPFLDCCRRFSLDAEHLPQLLTAALHEYDWSLGLRYSALLASPIWSSPQFLAFAHHLLCHADRFAADYNAALKSYRERNGIRTPGRPMPELVLKRDATTGKAGDADGHQDGDRCETPFWRDDLQRGRRVRAWVERAGGQWALVVGEDAFGLDPALPADEAADRLAIFLRRHQLRLAPRALTLTMTLRLLVADQFVHGIGGGQYDQVADEIIARFFAVDPPRFCVTTATLYWPTAAGRRRTDLPELLQALHRLKHQVLGDAKSELVSAIARAPRRSAERQQLFQRMHSDLAAASAASAELASWEQQLKDASVRVIEERAIFDRETFYALQPSDRLHSLIGTYGRMIRG